MLGAARASGRLLRSLDDIPDRHGDEGEDREAHIKINAINRCTASCALMDFHSSIFSFPKRLV
jgi:hypothetical protein